MTDRMRRKAGDALATLRTLAERGYRVEIEPGLARCTVVLSAPAGRPRFFDAGTLDDALLQIDMEQYPRRAA